MNKKKIKLIRSLLGAIFFIGITLLFLDFTGTISGFLSWMAKIQFLPALLGLNIAIIAAILIISVILGRIYCSVICPMGVFQDGIAHLHNWIKTNRYTYSKAHNILRYIILGLSIIAIIIGINSVLALLAPYSAYGRIVQNLFAPIYQWCNNGLTAISDHFNRYTFYSKDVWIRSLPTFIIASVTFVVIVILSWRNGRTYCNSICPVGTFLSFFSRFSWFRMHIDTEKCIKCGICSKNCKSSCIDGINGHVDYSRCVTCGNCMAACPKGAIDFIHKPSKEQVVTNNNSDFKESSKDVSDSIDNNKRAFLIGSVVAISTAAFAQEKKKVDGGLAFIEDKVAPERKTPIVPAGSISLKNFRTRCTGCQLCVSQCPNDVLRPSTELMNLMQPIMSFEKGYCRPECTKCSEVCPSGAISKILKEEKSSIKKGQAFWIHKNCIVSSNGINCGNCARHCPTQAIEMVPYESEKPNLLVPAINENKCIGCGACEYVCPARPLSAIYIEGIEQHRTI